MREWPLVSYAICTEIRSGSTYLCELLASTGALGRPDEFFRDSAYCAALERDPSLLDDVLHRGSSPNGVFGLKLFSHQFDVTRRSQWVRRFRISKFIFLRRRDVLAQAISCVRALQTQQYFAYQTARAAPTYDRAAIHLHLLRIVEGYSRWEAYFARNGIDPANIFYEDIVKVPDEVIAEVARHLGVESVAPVDFGQITVSSQSDQMTDEWRARFVEEATDLNSLDHVLGEKRIWLRRRARDLWYVRHKLGGG